MNRRYKKYRNKKKKEKKERKKQKEENRIDKNSEAVRFELAPHEKENPARNTLSRLSTTPPKQN